MSGVELVDLSRRAYDQGLKHGMLFPAKTNILVEREEQIGKLIRQRYGQITREDAQVFLSDYGYSPGSICYHARERAPQFEFLKTIASFIFHPQKRKKRISRSAICARTNSSSMALAKPIIAT